jgi:hypothetical protein
VPFVATCLIAEDLDLPVDDALPIMYTSSAIGNGMNPLDDDDEELEGIIQENYRLARHEEMRIAVRTCSSYASLPFHCIQGNRIGDQQSALAVGANTRPLPRMLKV